MNRRELLLAVTGAVGVALLGRDEHMWASDDLASIMIRPNVEFAGWGQGVIRAWDARTFENVVEYRGSQHENLPVASGVEALTYQPGDVVMLSRWKPSDGGGVTLRIGAGGRVIVPGTDAGEKVVSFLRAELAAQLGREILGQAFQWQLVADADTLPDTGGDWVDLSPAGPAVTVDIGKSGRCMVIVGARITASSNTNNAPLAAGVMSFAVTGQTNQAPDVVERAFFVGASVFTSEGNQEGSTTDVNGSKVVVIDGLNPGRHTLTAKYQGIALGGTGAVDPINVSDRVLVALPF